MKKVFLTGFFFVSLFLNAQNVDSLFAFDGISKYLDLSEKTIRTDVQPLVHKSDTYHFWEVGIFVFVVMLLIFLKNNYYKNVKDLFAAAININLSKQLQRELETSMAPYLLLLNFNALLIWTSISYMLIEHFDIDIPISLINLIVYITLFWFFAFFIRRRVLYIISKLFDFDGIYKQISFSDSLLIQISGIVFAPFIILVPFFTFPKILIVILVLGLLFLLIYMYAREFIIAKKYYDDSKYYFFLYLCALEILPWLVSIKIIKQIIFS